LVWLTEDWGPLPKHVTVDWYFVYVSVRESSSSYKMAYQWNLYRTSWMTHSAHWWHRPGLQNNNNIGTVCSYTTLAHTHTSSPNTQLEKEQTTNFRVYIHFVPKMSRYRQCYSKLLTTKTPWTLR